MQNYSHQGPTMLNLPHDTITAVPGQEHGQTQDSKGPPNHGCVSMPALYRTRAPASDYELTTARPAVVSFPRGQSLPGSFSPQSSNAPADSADWHNDPPKKNFLILEVIQTRCWLFRNDNRRLCCRSEVHGLSGWVGHSSGEISRNPNAARSSNVSSGENTQQAASRDRLPGTQATQ